MTQHVADLRERSACPVTTGSTATVRTSITTSSPFPLTGGHAGLECGSCHNDATSVEALQQTPQDCYSCHAKDDAHAGEFGTDCGSCHTPELGGGHLRPLEDVLPAGGRARRPQRATSATSAVKFSRDRRPSASPATPSPPSTRGPSARRARSAPRATRRRRGRRPRSPRLKRIPGGPRQPGADAHLQDLPPDHGDRLHLLWDATPTRQTTSWPSTRAPRSAELQDCIGCHPGGRGGD